MFLNRLKELTDGDEFGKLMVFVTDKDSRPIEGASVSIFSAGDVLRPIEVLITDNSGQTESIMLPAPQAELSLDENNIIQPYAQYIVLVQAQGYKSLDINGIEIFSGIDSVEYVTLEEGDMTKGDDIVISPNTLYGNYPPKIIESSVKNIEESGEIVLNRVVIPETVVVHDGNPADTTARNYYVPYTDYIKNVACSEIYATWPRQTIISNVLAIMSFTLNRVYTEW